MRANRRLLTQSFVAMSLFFVGSWGGGPAGAQEQASGSAIDGGYYARTQDPTTTAGDESTAATCEIPTLPPESPQQPHCSNVGTITATPAWPREDNYVYVARVRGNDEAYGFMGLDLSAVPSDSEIERVTFDFQIEDELDFGTIPAFDKTAPVAIRACLATSEWVAGDSGPWDKLPTFDCGISSLVAFVKEEVVSEPDDEGTFRDRKVVTVRSDLTQQANAWARGRPDYGLALLPTVGAPNDYQIAVRPPFSSAGKPTTTATIVYSPGQEGSLDSLLDDASVSFGTGSEEFGGAAGIPSVSEPAGAGAPGTTARTLSAGPARTPWWVWLIVPMGAAGLFVLSRSATAEVTLDIQRVGPVSKLVQKRKAGLT